MREEEQAQGLGALWVSGEEAVVFLNGQLTIDVGRLQQQWKVAGYCAPSGKVLAVMWVVPWQRDGVQGFYLLMPNVLLEAVQARLKKFILRSRVSLEVVALSMRVLNLGGEKALEFALPVAEGEAGGLCLTFPNGAVVWCGFDEQGTIQDWQELRALCIGLGMAMVYASTSDVFVPQMLGLTAIGAVEFDKGCYVGQEVVARLHYKSQVRQHLGWAIVDKMWIRDLQVGEALFYEQQKAAVVLDWAQGEQGFWVQAVIQQRFVGKKLGRKDKEEKIIFELNHEATALKEDNNG